MVTPPQEHSSGVPSLILRATLIIGLGLGITETLLMEQVGLISDLQRAFAELFVIREVQVNWLRFLLESPDYSGDPSGQGGTPHVLRGLSKGDKTLAAKKLYVDFEIVAET